MTLTEKPPHYIDWVLDYRPVKNNYTNEHGFDYGNGCTLMSYDNLHRYRLSHVVPLTRVWSLVELPNDGGLVIVVGITPKAYGYFVTKYGRSVIFDPIPVTPDNTNTLLSRNVTRGSY